MHSTQLLQQLLSQSVPSIHAARLESFITATQALTQGATATITSLGRGLSGDAYDKHKIKRMDRLLRNDHLHNESFLIYTALTRRILKGIKEPIILIDWSPLCPDQSWQLLRAAIPVGGRSLTLYEEVHPQSKLANRKIQHQFLDKLAAMLPSICKPIIVADSGFKTPFYRYIEEQLYWHWVGRIRGRDFIYKGKNWSSAKALHDKATGTGKNMGSIQWVKKNPLSAFIVLIRKTNKQRHALTYKGKKRQSKKNNVHAKREKEPWLLVASLSLMSRKPKQIVKIYSTRMQIEGSFRDCKSVHYGLGLSQNRHMNKNRRTVLCLIAACAVFILWCVGVAGKGTKTAKQVRVNSSSKRPTYSNIFLAKLLLSQKKFRLPLKNIIEALLTINLYMESVLCD